MNADKYGAKAKGIFEGLQEEKNTGTQEDKSTGAKKAKSKSVQEEYKKRSFQLTAGQVEKLYMLKAKNNDKTLSSMVGEAIEEYYERHMESED